MKLREFSPRQQRAVLRSLLRHWWPSFVPIIAKALLLQRQYFTDEKIRRVVNELLLNGGDLELVKAEFQKKPEPWHAKFFCVGVQSERRRVMRKFWAVYSGGHVLPFTVRRTRTESRKTVEHSFNRSWRKLKREGCKFVRVWIQPEGGAS
ncbi:MAG: hypothetical protein WDM76_09600 [Limisphaerales bacterium]